MTLYALGVPREFVASTFIHSTPEDVFDFVADYRNVQPVLEGITHWQPISRKTRGAGATFKVAMQGLGLPLEDILQLDEWERPRAIGWHSIGGVMQQNGRWSFTPRNGGVEAQLRIIYDPPVGVFGEAVAGPLQSLVSGRLRKALQRMRDIIESGEEAEA